MKTDLKAKYVQHLINKKKNDEGFTLIELLVVIIIIGILSAIALPSFLNQANKARESEAKQYIGSMNRAQQAYYLENREFVQAISNAGRLGLGIATDTENYDYAIAGVSATDVTNQAQPSEGATASVRAFIGGVAVGVITATSEATTLATLCQADDVPLAGGDSGVQTVVATGDATADCIAAGNYTAIQ